MADPREQDSGNPFGFYAERALAKIHGLPPAPLTQDSSHFGFRVEEAYRKRQAQPKPTAVQILRQMGGLNIDGSSRTAIPPLAQRPERRRDDPLPLQGGTREAHWETGFRSARRQRRREENGGYTRGRGRR